MPPEARYYQNPGSPLSHLDYHTELLASLGRINIYNPPVATCSTGWRFSGLYSGPTGIAYLFYRLSELYPDLEFKQQSLLEWAEAYLALGNHVKKHNPDASHCGIANETLAHTAVSSLILNDTSLAEKLCAYENIINDASNDGSNEWLYGRAGYLFFLRACRRHFAKSNHTGTVDRLTSTMKKTTKRIAEVPLPWTWHGKEYLGAAHGTIGIISQCILSDPSTSELLTDVLEQTLATQYPSGNFPSSNPPYHDELVQFCHGAPGFVIALQPVLGYFSDRTKAHKQITYAMQKAQDTIWERGLLTKDPCLCHGIAGNALALDDQERFETFLSLMTSDSLEQNGWLQEAGHTDRFASLYDGEAGRAWVWAVADKGLGVKGGCIGFSDV